MAPDDAPSGTLSALLKRATNSADGLTQQGLADRSGVPLATLNAWTSGRRVPQNTPKAKDQLRRLAEHLPGVTAKDLFEAIGQQVPGPMSAEAEARTFALYRNLSGRRRRVVDQIVETLAAEEKERPPEDRAPVE